jgi:hypothetical protein
MAHQSRAKRLLRAHPAFAAPVSRRPMPIVNLAAGLRQPARPPMMLARRLRRR